ncbi:MAG: protein-disulfide reductase DsbD family protein [Phycisphaerales bacterium]
MLIRPWPRLLVLVLSFLALWAHPAPLAAQFGGDESRLAISAHAQRRAVYPNDHFAIAVVIEYQPGWHSWPNFKPPLPEDLADLDIRLTTVTAAPVAGLALHVPFAQWPEPHEELVAGSRVRVFSGRTIVYIPVIVAPDAAPGPRTISLEVAYQACDATTCEAPTAVNVSVPVTVHPLGEVIEPGTPNDAESARLFAAFQPAVFAQILSGQEPAPGVRSQEFDFLGAKFSLRSDAYVLIMLIAFVAGVLMNFTPCVLPVIPIKILSIQSHAKSPGKLLYLGTIYCAGIVLLYLVLGLLAFGLITGGRRFDWGQLFSLPWFTLSMAVIVAGLGLAMIGGWSLRLPNFVYSINPTGDRPLGNLLGGLLTGVLATPCTGPLLGASFAWSVTQPPLVGLSAITMLGVGMAAPYALLILFPRLIDRLPRGGAGGELLKQVLGGFMLAVAAYLAGNLFEGTWPWWVVGGVAMVSSAWLVIGAWRMLSTRRTQVICTVLGLCGVVGFFAMSRALTREGPLSWTVFKDRPESEISAAINSARARGDVVVIDFTAKWCVNCHVIERTTLNSDAGIALLTAKGITLLKVDLTNAVNEDAAEPPAPGTSAGSGGTAAPGGTSGGWGLVRDISGGGGIPLIAVFGPGIDRPIYFQSFFPISALEQAVSTARGTGARPG